MMVHEKNPFLRWPRRFFTCLILILVVAWVLRPQNQVDGSLNKLLENDPQQAKTMEVLQEILEDDTGIFLLISGPDLLSASSIRRLKQIDHLLDQELGLEDVKSITHSFIPIRRGFSFQFEPLIPPEPWSADHLNQLRTFITTHPLTRNLMMTPNGEHTLITATIPRSIVSNPAATLQLHQTLRSALHRILPDDHTFLLSSLPWLEHEMRQAWNKDLSRFRWTVPLLLLLFGLTFGSWKSLLHLLVTGVCFSALVFLVLSMIPYRPSLGTALALPFILGSFLTLQFHVMHALQIGHQTCPDLSKCWIREAVTPIETSCWLAGMTTMIGTASLLFCPYPALKEMGWVASLGIFLSLLWTFGPNLSALRILFDVSPPKPPPEWINKSQNFLWRSISSSRISSALIPVLGSAVVFSAIGLSRWKHDFRISQFLPGASESHQVLEFLDQKFGGIQVFRLEIKPPPGQNAFSPGFLKYLDTLEKEISAQSNVTGVFSYALLFKLMNQIWDGGSPAALKLPENRLTIGLFLAALQTQDLPWLALLGDADGSKVYFIIRSQEMSSDQYLIKVNQWLRLAESFKPEESISVSAQEGLHTFLEAQRNLFHSLWFSLAGTVVGVSLLLYLLWRSIRMVALAVLMVALPVSITLALGSLAGIPLNLMTLGVAALAISIALDDVVHWIAFTKSLGSTPAAGRLVWQTKFLPITVTSLIWIVMFVGLAQTSFPPLQQFGGLCALSLVLALLFLFSFLPGFLDKQAREKRNKILS